MRRRLLVAAPALALAGFLVGPVAPAAGHTELVSSRPAPQSVLRALPPDVSLEFSRAVEAGAGAIRVLDRALRPVEAGPVTAAGAGRSVSVPLHAEDAQGVFTVSWRVVAEDGHPLQGAFTFRVDPGDRARPTASTLGASERQAGDGLVGALLGVSRWLAYAGLIVLLGVAAFLLLAWPSGWADERVRRSLWAGWLAAVMGTWAGLALQGPNTTGRSLGHALDGELLREVAGTRVGEAWLARLALLGVVAAMLARSRRDRPAPRPVQLLWGTVGAGLCTTAAVAGHAATSDVVAFALVTDVVHLAAAAIWLGGLVVLVVAVLRSPPVDRGVVGRFSRIALACVVVVAATGSLQAWRQVGPAAALTHTRYGALLIAKVAAFVVLVAVAALSRRWVRRRVRDAPVRPLRRSVGSEVALATVVLAVASVLVATPPGRTAFARPFRADLATGPLRLHVEVAPTKVGPVQLDVRSTTPDGAEAPVTFIAVELRLPKDDIGPLFVRMQRISPGHYRAAQVELPLPGRWELSAQVFLTGGAKPRSTTSFGVT